LYQAWHEIVPLRKTHFGTVTADIVGPICETGDFLARDREVANLMPGDMLAVLTAGAYGFVAARTTTPGRAFAKCSWTARRGASCGAGRASRI